jgi:hypothetical protein
VRTAVTILDIRTIEAEREEVEVVRPPLPRDANVVFDFQGTKRTVALKEGANAWDQAYTVQVWNPSVYPVVFVKGDERVTSWVNDMRLKITQEEARRLFGGRPTIELLLEPGLVYQIKTAQTRSQKPKGIPESNTRQTTGLGIKPVVPPSLTHRRATPAPPISQRSTDGRDIQA